MKQQYRQISLLFGATCIVIGCAFFAAGVCHFFPEAVYRPEIHIDQNERVGKAWDRMAENWVKRGERK